MSPLRRARRQIALSGSSALRTVDGFQPAGDQPVDEALNVTGADILELRRAERRIDVFAQRLLVAA